MLRALRRPPRARFGGRVTARQVMAAVPKELCRVAERAVGEQDVFDTWGRRRRRRHVASEDEVGNDAPTIEAVFCGAVAPVLVRRFGEGSVKFDGKGLHVRDDIGVREELIATSAQVCAPVAAAARLIVEWRAAVRRRRWIRLLARVLRPRAHRHPVRAVQ